MVVLALSVALVVAQVVANWTLDQEVPSSIPTGNWACISSLFYLSISGASFIRSLVEVQHY